jgi:hypothetical protein
MHAPGGEEGGAMVLANLSLVLPAGHLVSVKEAIAPHSS